MKHNAPGREKHMDGHTYRQTLNHNYTFKHFIWGHERWPNELYRNIFQFGFLWQCNNRPEVAVMEAGCKILEIIACQTVVASNISQWWYFNPVVSYMLLKVITVKWLVILLGFCGKQCRTPSPNNLSYLLSVVWSTL